jgi:hypothetical protein
VRIPATNRGVVWGKTPFIATIAVPQRKNGAINRMDEPRVKGLGKLIVIE